MASHSVILAAASTYETVQYIFLLSCFSHARVHHDDDNNNNNNKGKYHHRTGNEAPEGE
jgi:hypothetical protein